MRYTRALRAAPIIVPALLVAVGTTAQAQTVASQAAGTSSRAQSAPSGWRPLTPAQAKTLSRNVTDKVIVVLRNQFPSLPDTPANSARRTAAGELGAGLGAVRPAGNPRGQRPQHLPR